jgi:hypothetical protein
MPLMTINLRHITLYLDDAKSLLHFASTCKAHYEFLKQEEEEDCSSDIWRLLTLYHWTNHHRNHHHHHGRRRQRQLDESSPPKNDDDDDDTSTVGVVDWKLEYRIRFNYDKHAIVLIREMARDFAMEVGGTSESLDTLIPSHSVLWNHPNWLMLLRTRTWTMDICRFIGNNNNNNSEQQHDPMVVAGRENEDSFHSKLERFFAATALGGLCLQDGMDERNQIMDYGSDEFMLFHETFAILACKIQQTPSDLLLVSKKWT